MTIRSRNVICVLPGNEGSGLLAMSAHYDHLGVATPVNGDSIYNGFSDNSAGVAMLLSIASALKAGPQLRHDVAFLFFSAEERGLLGSYHMAANPPWGVGDLAGLVNLDAGAPPAPPQAWEVVGGTQNEVGATAVRVAERNGWAVRSSSIRPNSDYYPFSLRGIHTTFLIPGARPYEGMTLEQSDSLFNRWDAYHRPGDEWSEDFPFSGVKRYAEFALEVIRELDRD